MPNAEQVARLQARADRLNRISFALSVALLAVLVALRVAGTDTPASSWIVAIGLVVGGATGVFRLPHRVSIALLALCITTMLGTFLAAMVRMAR